MNPGLLNDKADTNKIFGIGSTSKKLICLPQSDQMSRLNTKNSIYN